MTARNEQIAVRATGLGKEFRGGRPALVDVDLVVARGSSHGLIGANGAGKSTLLRLLAGMQRPTRGGLEVFGRAPWRAGAAHSRRISFVMSPSLVDGSRSIRENVRHIGALYGTRINVDDMLEKCGADRPDRAVGKLSLGMRTRLQIALAVAVRPSLLLLDEAFNALDLNSAAWLRGAVRDALDDGCTVIVASHVLHEVVEVCDAMTIMRAGAVRATLSREELLSRRPTGSVQVTVPAELARAACRTLATRYTVHERVNPRDVAIVVDAAEPADVCRRLADAGIWPTSLVPVERSLEDVVATLLSRPASSGARLA